jgi:carboxymethylenebutenolidase
MEDVMDGQMVQYDENAGRMGYLAVPQGGSGPGRMVLHAWWGLNDFFTSVCDRLAAEGYAAFAPDLYGCVVLDTRDDAEKMVKLADQAVTAGALDEALGFLERQPAVRSGGSGARRIGVIGFSLGAAYAAAASTLRPDLVRAVVLFYGTYAPDFSHATAAYLGHFAEHDEWEPREGVDELQAALEQAGRPVSFHFYPGTGHWFFEANRPDAYQPEAAQLAWQRTLAFLSEQLG